MGKLSICLVSRVMPAHGSGGMQVHTWDLATGLAARGHLIHVITAAHPQGGGLRVETSSDVTVHYAPSAIPRRYTSKWWRECQDLFRRLHEEIRFDVIVSADAGAFPLLSARRRDRLAPPCVMIRHGTTLSEVRTALRSISLRKALAIPYMLGLYLAYGRRLLPRVEAMIAVTERVRADALRESAVNPENVFVVSNGVDTSFFTPARVGAERADARFHVLGVGRMIREKGFDTLLRAVAELPAGTNLRVSLAGEGPAIPSLRRLVEENGLAGVVSFVGRLARPSLRSLYQSADVVVIPSRRDEGLPFAILEGMASGLPLLVTTVGDGTGIVDEEGFRFAAGNARQLADCIRRLVGMPEDERRRIGDRNRQIAQERYSIERMVAEIEAIVVSTAEAAARAAPSHTFRTT